MDDGSRDNTGSEIWNTDDVEYNGGSIPELSSLESATKIAHADVDHRSQQFGISEYNSCGSTGVISDLILLVFFKTCNGPRIFLGIME